MSKTPLNVNPMGISYREGVLAITSYFQPAIIRGPLTNDGNLTWYPTSIGGAEGTTRWMPHDLAYGRAQTVALLPDGTMWVTWNKGRMIRVFDPPADEGGRWSLNREIKTPNVGTEMIHSLGIALNPSGSITVATIESGDDFDEPWSSCFYSVIPQTGRLQIMATRPISPWRYGICRHNELWWTVTDTRTKERKGIYARNDHGQEELIVRGVTGNGIVFLHDGSAIVTQYSDTLDEPGAILSVPASMFQT